MSVGPHLPLVALCSLAIQASISRTRMFDLKDGISSGAGTGDAGDWLYQRPKACGHAGGQEQEHVEIGDNGDFVEHCIGQIDAEHPQEKQEQPDLGLIQPHLFLPSGKLVGFWFGRMTPPREQIAELYAALGKTEAEVFPLTFAAEEGLATGIVSGSVPGFCSIGEGNEVRIHK